MSFWSVIWFQLFVKFPICTDTGGHRRRRKEFLESIQGNLEKDTPDKRQDFIRGKTSSKNPCLGSCSLAVFVILHMEIALSRRLL